MQNLLVRLNSSELKLLKRIAKSGSIESLEIQKNPKIATSIGFAVLTQHKFIEKIFNGFKITIHGSNYLEFHKNDLREKWIKYIVPTAVSATISTLIASLIALSACNC